MWHDEGEKFDRLIKYKALCKLHNVKQKLWGKSFSL